MTANARSRTALSPSALTDRARRLDTEARILARYWPTVRLQDTSGGPHPGAVGTLTTQAGHTYTLFIDLARFPMVPPPAFVVRPALKDRDGLELRRYGVNASMHVLGGGDDGRVEICHHGEHCWTPRLTLHHVLLKLRVWLEAYEGHLRTGLPLDHWLGHQ